MTVLNWEPLGRKVKAALLELGWDDDRLYALAESQLSEMMDHGLSDPYELIHVFGTEGGTLSPPDSEPQFIITQSEEHERTLRVDMVRFVDMTDQLFPDGIPDDHPLMKMSPSGEVKGIKFPEPDYDEDIGDMH